jgi:uroporphyrinogen decarboxylase
MEGYYRHLLQLSNLIAVFPGDDMGFRSGTLIAPEHLRGYTLPWHRRFARMAHDAGLPYFVHSCGNVEAVMEDLIADVRIDGKHSFEDAIMPIREVQAKYGDRIAVLGGVDVDVLTRQPPERVREYVRSVIDACAPRGRFAVGSGNSIPSYIPVENYLTMLDEALR